MMQVIRPANKFSLTPKICLALAAMMGSASLSAQDDIAEITARGQELFFERVSCWICHGENAEGLIGPSRPVAAARADAHGHSGAARL